MVKTWLFEIENKYPGTAIDTYVVMPDHMHFILFTTGVRDEKADTRGGGASVVPLPDVIRWFKTMTTNDYIRGIKSGMYVPFDKHLWQRNYYEHIVRNEEDLHEIRAYIAGNPLKGL